MEYRLDPSVLDTARKSEGLTSDEQLGAAVGKTSSTIRNYRIGKTVPNIETLMRLKEITHRPLDTMIIRSDALAA